jgi:nucleotide-binding universal stress UspA family protein
MSVFPMKILLATDGSEDAALAAKAAVDLAGKTDSELHVVHARLMLPWTGYSPAETAMTSSTVDEEEQARERVMRWLDDQVERIKAEGGNVAQAYLRLGRPDEGVITVAEEIVSLAEEIGAGLMVVGSRGLGGIRRALMGSVSDSVVRHAHCPVLVVRREEKDEEVGDTLPTKILLATDGSEEASLAAEVAVEIAVKTGSELHVIHVRPKIVPHYPGYYLGPEVMEDPQQKEQKIRDREAQRLLDAQVEIAEVAGISVAQTHLRMGRPQVEITTLAEEIRAGLIVVGSRGLSGMRRALMGSVSGSVVRHAHCRVLVVRKEDGR